VSVNAPLGFVASGVSCGIKPSGDRDLALVATDDGRPVPAAGVFTSNLAAAAPVRVSREHLATTGGRASAVVVSSGNANAATGAAGIDDARRICDLVANGLEAACEEVLVCQTGLIGIPLPMARFESGIADLVSAREADARAAALAAEAMMTTDTVRKEVVVDRPGFLVGGMGKGAAMLAPDMATMLVVLTTDAICEPAMLHGCLSAAVDGTFNQLTIDGCTSTNDSVVVLAGGRSGHSASEEEMTSALADACGALATMMAADAEGGTKVARVTVAGAATEREARHAARRVAQSSLVKCSLNGEDPYWGRVLSELGSAGVEMDVDRAVVAYGGVVVCRGGTAADHDRTAVEAHMKQQNIEISCDLGAGSARAEILTCDLGHGYIDENRTTS
jgi:glutamate N-acetyltransferase/amino-acid N-acetyltransferase